MMPNKKYGVYELSFDGVGVPKPIKEFFLPVAMNMDINESVKCQTKDKFSVYFFDEINQNLLISLLREHLIYCDEYELAILLVCVDNKGKPSVPSVIINSSIDDTITYLLFNDYHEGYGIQNFINKMKFSKGKLLFIDDSDLFFNFFSAYKEFCNDFRVPYDMSHSSTGLNIIALEEFRDMFNLWPEHDGETSIEKFGDKIRREGTYKHNHEKIIDECKNISDDFTFLNIVEKHTRCNFFTNNYFFEWFWSYIPDNYFYETYKYLISDAFHREWDTDIYFQANVLERVLKLNTHDTVENYKLNASIDADGYLTIYYPGADIGGSNVWTMDKNVAKYHGVNSALINSCHNYIVITGKVKLSDIISSDFHGIGDFVYGDAIIVLRHNVKIQTEEIYIYDEQEKIDLNDLINKKIHYAERTKKFLNLIVKSSWF